MGLAVEQIQEQYAADGLEEFLAELEEVGLEVVESNDEYSVYREANGMLVAYFCAMPEQGPAGGWINYTYIG